MSGPSKVTTILAERAILPGRDKPESAAIDVDPSTGRITAIRNDLTAADGADIVTIPKGRLLLPGLIE